MDLEKPDGVPAVEKRVDVEEVPATAVVEQAEGIDLEKLYPDRDPWLYRVTQGNDWADDELVLYGRRRSHQRIDVQTGIRACWKGDNEHMEAFTEKVCADLAQILGLPIPAGIIERWPDDGQIACVSKRPARKMKGLNEVRGDNNFHPANEARLHGFSARYPGGLMAFDLWVDNWDKHAGNLLLVRSTGQLWSIDYGSVFGMIWKRIGDFWANDGYKEPYCPRPEIPNRNLPIPSFVSEADLKRELEVACAGEIGDLSDDIIGYIVHRAAVPYGSAAADMFAEEVADRLCYRRRKVMEWVQKRLP